MPLTRESKFTLRKELKGSTGAINSLLFSDDGKYLLCGGDDEKVRIWNTETLNCEQVLENDKWGQVTTLTWVYHEFPTRSTSISLCVGSARGNVTLIPMVPGSKPFASKEAVSSNVFSFNDSIEAQAYEPVNSRLIITSHSGLLKSFNVEKLNLKLLWTGNLSNAIPRAVFFVDGASKNVMALGLETGELVCWEGAKGSVLWRKTLAGGIGNAALSADETTLLVDNLTTGSFDVYRTPSDTPLRSLTPTSVRRFTKQCQFLEGSVVAILGSDTNKIHVMDITSNECVQTLVAGKETELTQTVAGSIGNPNKHFIAGACGDSVYLWEKEFETEVVDELQETPERSRIRGYAAQGPVNGPLVFLVMVLTYSSWSPYFFEESALVVSLPPISRSKAHLLQGTSYFFKYIEFGEKRVVGFILLFPVSSKDFLRYYMVD